MAKSIIAHWEHGLDLEIAQNHNVHFLVITFSKIVSKNSYLQAHSVTAVSLQTGYLFYHTFSILLMLQMPQFVTNEEPHTNKERFKLLY